MIASRRFLCAAAGALLAGCASWPSRYGPRPCGIATKPVVRRQPIGWHLFDVTVLSQLQRSFQLIRQGRRLSGVPVEAFNMEKGELADSVFFTNRDPSQMSLEAVRWGPTQPEDVAQPPFVVTKPKTEGKTPGFFVTDAKGRRYLFKLDPVESPELLSGAEVVTSKLLHALGYHVPSDEIVEFGPDDLRVGPELTAKDARGRAHPFTADDLRSFVEPRLRGGRCRVVASQILDGEILGPATFKHFRDCAEMRALKVTYAWLNNIDAKDHNSLLIWDGRQTTGYLIDFGTSLGADAGHAGPKDPCAGRLNVVDLPEVSLNVLTLGWHQPACDVPTHPVSPGVGRFSAEVDPDRWKPYAPNLAFEEITKEDARWIAGRMARLSRAQVEAAVSAGRYADPRDAAYLTETLMQRRDAIVRRYLEAD